MDDKSNFGLSEIGTYEIWAEYTLLHGEKQTCKNLYEIIQLRNIGLPAHDEII